MKFCEAIAQGQPAFDTVLAPQVPANRSVIARWRMDDAFCDWLDAFTERMFRRGMTKLLLRAFSLGLKGSVKHMEFFARYSGQIDQADMPAPMGGGATLPAGAAFVIAVPRPAGAVPESAILIGSSRATP